MCVCWRVPLWSEVGEAVGVVPDPHIYFECHNVMSHTFLLAGTGSCLQFVKTRNMCEACFSGVQQGKACLASRVVSGADFGVELAELEAWLCQFTTARTALRVSQALFSHLFNGHRGNAL